MPRASKVHECIETFAEVDDIPPHLRQTARACFNCLHRTAVVPDVAVAVALWYGPQSVSLQIGCESDGGTVTAGCNNCPDFQPLME